jgi:predicted phosphodiesterase
MREKQHSEVEFNMSKQIVKATELVIMFLTALSEYVNAEYAGIPGNHDRMHGNKDISLDDDNATVIINSNIKWFIKLINSERLKFIDVEDDATEINLVINDKKIKCRHGHLDNGNKKDRMKSYISMENDFFDCLLYGHLHHFNVVDSDHGRMTVGSGCLSGRNTHSTTLGGAVNASQVMLVVTGEGDLLPLRIDLQIV